MQSGWTNSFSVIAHRGGLGYGPENALSTIEQSLQLDVDAIEVDVYGVDGELFITHDRRLGKTLPGSGKLQSLTAEQASDLTLSNGEKLATLKQLLNLIGKRADINLEIKGSDNITPQLINTVMEFVNKGHCAIEQFIISSFDHRHLVTAQALNPSIKRGVLLDGLPCDYCASFSPLTPWSVHPRITFIPQELIDDAHKRGYKVYVYTVNDIDDIDDMLDMGVDGIFTDYPDRVIAQLQARAR